MSAKYVLFLAVIVGIFGTMIELPRAQAATITYTSSANARLYGMCDLRPKHTVVKTPDGNREYCRMIRDNGVKVVGAGRSEIEALCAEWGVTI